MPLENKPLFTRTIQRLLRNGGISSVSLVDSKKGHAIAVNGLPNIQPVPRLIICLKGKSNYEYTINGQRKEWSLEEGEAIFIPTGSWLKVCASSNYESLGIVFFSDITRFILVKCNARLVKHPRFPFNLNDKVLIWPTPLTDEGRTYIGTLSNLHSRTNLDLSRLSLFNLILDEVDQSLKSKIDEHENNRSHLSWKAACSFINDHLHLPFSREDVAHFLKLHPNHISRIFTQFSGCTFSRYVTEKRMERAKSMLADPRWNVTEVSLNCGFTSLSYFSRMCHKEFGLPPTEYRAVLMSERSKEKQ